MSICPASGFFIQSQPGGGHDHGNFEVVIPTALPNGGFSHYWRNNAASGLPWSKPIIFGTYRYTSIAVCESDFKSVHSNKQFNFELLARPQDRNQPALDFAWHENGGQWLWHGPFPLPFNKGVANPSIVAARSWVTYGDTGPLHAVIPRANGGFDFYSRPGPDDPTATFIWQLIDTVDGPLFQGASLILSYVHTFDHLTDISSYGDFVVAAVAQDGTLQLFWKRFGVDPWQGPFSFGREILPGIFGNVFVGRPSLIQTSYNEISGPINPFAVEHYGNYDLIVPLQGGASLTSGRRMGRCQAAV